MTLDRITSILATASRLVAPAGPESTSPSAERPVAPAPSTDWLPGAPTDAEALDKPGGWYEQAIACVSATSSVRVVSLAVEHLSTAERAETRAFTRHTLDSSDGRIRPFALAANTYTWTSPSWSVLVKADQHVVTHAGVLYRVIQVGDLRVPIGGIGGVMTLPQWRGKGYAQAALAGATAFIAAQLWAPFALAICPADNTAFYEKIGWRVCHAPIWCEQPGARVTLADEVAVFLPCQGDARWPVGDINLDGSPW